MQLTEASCSMGPCRVQVMRAAPIPKLTGPAAPATPDSPVVSAPPPVVDTPVKTPLEPPPGLPVEPKAPVVETEEVKTQTAPAAQEPRVAPVREAVSQPAPPRRPSVFLPQFMHAQLTEGVDMGEEQQEEQEQGQGQEQTAPTVAPVAVTPFLPSESPLPRPRCAF